MNRHPIADVTRKIEPIFVVLFIIFLFPVSINAETSSELSTQEEAIVLFQQAREAYRNGRVADARDLFRRSLELEPRFTTAWNLAGMLRATNELIDAMELLQGILDGAYGEIDDQQRAETRALRGEIEPRLATLRVSTSISEPVEVFVDEETRGLILDDRSLELIVVAGSHTVVGRTETMLQDEHVVEAEEGSETTIVLDPVSTDELDPVPPTMTPVSRRPWFWVVLSAAVTVVVVGAVSLGLYFSYETDPARYVDPIFGNTFALRGEPPR